MLLLQQTSVRNCADYFEIFCLGCVGVAAWKRSSLFDTNRLVHRYFWRASCVRVGWCESMCNILEKFTLSEGYAGKSTCPCTIKKNKRSFEVWWLNHQNFRAMKFGMEAVHGASRLADHVFLQVKAAWDNSRNKKIAAERTELLHWTLFLASVFLFFFCNSVGNFGIQWLNQRLFCFNNSSDLLCIWRPLELLRLRHCH